MRKRSQKARMSIYELKQYEYPVNLLLAVEDCPYGELTFPVTKDTHLGIQFAVSLLKPREEDIILLRYRDGWTREKIGTKYGITGSRVGVIEEDCLEKLRHPTRLCYIRDGLVWTFRSRMKYEYDRGYERGRNVGYKQGIEDAKNQKLRADIDADITCTPLTHLNLSTRTFNCLHRRQCETVGDFAHWDDDEILRTRNLGPKGIREIANTLLNIGVSQTEWDKYAG